MTQGKGARILVVEDDPGIQRAVKANLTRHDFDVETVDNGTDALERYIRYHPDLILLDLGLPDMDGTDVIREVRGHSRTPIVVLSVRGGEHDKVEALNLGADDYLTKPFGVEELLARVRVALRHGAGAAAGTPAVFRSGDLVVDVEHRRVRVGDEEIRLTPTEYDLLKTFISQPDKVLTDRMLLHAVWGPEYGTEAHYLHVYVARLRRKIEKDPQKPQHLLNEPGVGYRLVSEPI